MELRKTHGLQPTDPFPATKLASALGVTVWRERDVRNISSADLEQLTVKDADSWSAFTLRINTNHLIVYNSSQTDYRINSVVMHELSHIMLGHELTSAGITDDGHLIPATYDQDQEDEADWMAGTLLLPRPILIKIRLDGMSNDAAIHFFQVSSDMLNWRIRMTGVDYQLGAARNRWSA
ncbi:ImmA/IrrE family metallo-endopeptidase [Mesorhizobium sp. 128a]